MIAAVILISIDMRTVSGNLMNMLTQSFALRILHHVQAHLSTLPTNCSQNWRAVIGKAIVYSKLHWTV